MVTNERVTVYVSCRPLTDAPPKDLPRVESLAKEYWCARFLTRTDQDIHSLSDWFSIPYRNIQESLYKSPRGPCIIQLTALPQSDQEKLLQQTKPVFSIEEEFDTKTARWLHKHSDEH